jgi:hypothetical protein
MTAVMPRKTPKGRVAARRLKAKSSSKIPALTCSPIGWLQTGQEEHVAAQ